MLYAGCDLGIASAKAVIVEEERLLAAEIVPYSGFPQEAASNALGAAMARAGAGRHDLRLLLATGFGGKAVAGADGVVPDTNCLQRSIRKLNPHVRTIFNAGAHSFNVFHLNDAGELGELVITDQCTAGMGLMLETVAAALDLPIDDPEAGAAAPAKPLFTDSQCPIFAESEAISLINEGCDRHAVFAGVAASVAGKIAGLARRLGIVPEVAMVGGVAKNGLVMDLVQRKLGLHFAGLGGLDPQLAAAYGAALLAREGCVLDAGRLSDAAARHIRKGAIS